MAFSTHNTRIDSPSNARNLLLQSKWNYHQISEYGSLCPWPQIFELKCPRQNAGNLTRMSCACPEAFRAARLNKLILLFIVATTFPAAAVSPDFSRDAAITASLTIPAAAVSENSQGTAACNINIMNTASNVNLANQAALQALQRRKAKTKYS